MFPPNVKEVIFLNLSSLHPEARINGGCCDYINTVYEEGLYVGYRYFDTFSKTTAFGFGHGLSYTNFSCTYEMTVWTEPETLDQIVAEVKAHVKNEGAYAGKEVVQVYVQIPDGKLEQSSRRLVGFAKTKLLNSGESQELVITVQGREIASFDTERAAWICEPGTWKFFAGTSLGASKCITDVDVKAEKVLRKSKNYMPLPETFPLQTLSKKNPEETYPKGGYSGKTGADGITPPGVQKYTGEKNPICPKQRETLLMWDAVQADPDLLEDFVGQFSDYELARMCVCAKNGWGMEEKGEAGRLYVFEKYGTPEFAFADGNNGVNMKAKNIGFPTSVTVCATFNEELAYQAGAAIADERTLRELYLKVFEEAFQVHRPAALMTSYNAINSVYGAESEDMLQGIFTEEFGFEGFVMTDWTSSDTCDIVNAVAAGNGWITPGGMDDSQTMQIVEGIQNGRIDRKRIQKNVYRMFRVVLQFAQKTCGI